MSNFKEEHDKLTAHLEQLRTRHRSLDKYIEDEFHNINVTSEVRQLKTQKLWIKDEIHRIESRLKEIEPNGHG